MLVRSTRRRGFTMVEVLTVIAIIAILAAILFPVFARVNAGVREARCMTNMSQIHQALTMYHDNWNVYPLVLDSVVIIGAGAPLTLRPLAAYTKAEELFRCPSSQYNKADAGQVAFAANQLTPVGTALRWHAGNGNITAIQWYQRRPGGPIEWLGGGSSQPVQFPLRDSYDGGLVANRIGNPWVLHYNPNWTDAEFRGGVSLAQDNPRQMKYRSPSPSTVVTWCTNHAEVDPATGQILSGNTLVLFLDGHVHKLQGKLAGQWQPNGANPWNNPAIPPFTMVPKS